MQNAGFIQSGENLFNVSLATAGIYIGIYTTFISDSLISSKNYEVQFTACTDADGNNYSIVIIDVQTWMAENLTYLDSVSPSSEGSGNTPYYNVYGYEGTSIDSVKATTNYTA